MTNANVNPKQIAALMTAGFRWYEQGRLRDAKKIFEGLAVLDESNCYAHGVLGSIYQKEKNYDAAIERYNLAIALFPHDPNIFTNRGEIFLKLGKLEEAAGDLKKAIDLDPTRKHPASNRARLLVKAMQDALQSASLKN